MCEKLILRSFSPSRLPPPSLLFIISGGSFSLFRLFQRRILIAFIDCRDEGNRVLLIIPCHSTSLSLCRPSFLSRSLNHTLRLLSLNNGEPLPPLFSLSSLHILLSWDAAHCPTLKSTPLAAATFLRDLPESTARKLATHLGSTPDESLRGLFNGLDQQSR